MSSGHLSLGVIRVQIDVRKNSPIGIPSTDVSFDIAQHELFAGRPSLFDYKSRMRSCGLFYGTYVQTTRDATRNEFRPRVRRLSTRSILPIAVVVWFMSNYWTSVGPEGSTALVAVLRTIQILSFTPVTCDHRSRSRVATPHCSGLGGEAKRAEGF